MNRPYTAFDITRRAYFVRQDDGLTARTLAGPFATNEEACAAIDADQLALPPNDEQR